MSGFGAYAHNYDIKLFQRPFYRKEGGQDPIKTFVQTSGMQYLKNAERIRDMRFARSNEYNPDVAIRAEREDLLSKTFYENKANTDLAGLRGRLGLQLSRTGGSLSKKENKVTGSVEPTAGSSSVSPQTTKIAGGAKQTIRNTAATNQLQSVSPQTAKMLETSRSRVGSPAGSGAGLSLFSPIFEFGVSPIRGSPNQVDANLPSNTFGGQLMTPRHLRYLAAQSRLLAAGTSDDNMTHHSPTARSVHASKQAAKQFRDKVGVAKRQRKATAVQRQKLSASLGPYWGAGASNSDGAMDRDAMTGGRPSRRTRSRRATQPKSTKLRTATPRTTRIATLTESIRGKQAKGKQGVSQLSRTAN